MLRILAQNMPLIVITGIPCSGKSTVTKAIKEHLETQSKKVRILLQLTEPSLEGEGAEEFWGSENGICRKRNRQSIYYC